MRREWRSCIRLWLDEITSKQSKATNEFNFIRICQLISIHQKQMEVGKLRENGKGGRIMGALEEENELRGERGERRALGKPRGTTRNKKNQNRFHFISFATIEQWWTRELGDDGKEGHQNHILSQRTFD